MWVSKQSQVGIGVVFLISLLSMIVAQWVTNASLQNAIFAGAATLLFGGLLGGFLKILLDDVVAGRTRRADAATFVMNVLTDLKAVYDRVGRSQIIIPAHQSVKTYGDEMRDLIAARVQLKNVIRALDGRADGIATTTRDEVIREVTGMKEYLNELTTEFKTHYKELSDLQRLYEARVSSITETYGGRRGAEAPEPYPTFPWDRLEHLPVLNDFIKDGQTFRADFEARTDKASKLLRDELAHILGRRR